MQPIQIIIELLSNKGVSAAKMCKELGFSSGIFYQWKQGNQNPSLEKLRKMAEYFGVTTDYLLGNEQKNKPALNGEPINVPFDLIKKLNLISDDGLAKIADYIDLILLQEKSEKK